jgi:Flp pilus assembly protein TadD
MTLPRPACLLALLAASCSLFGPSQPPAPKIKDVPSSLVRMGDTMRSNGDPAGAMNLYRSASRDTPQSAPPMERMGEAYNELGDRPRAEQAFRAATVLNPADAAAKRGLAVTLLGEGHADEALPLFQSLAQGSSDPVLLRDLGAALDMVGRNSEAQATYRRALAQAPADAALHGNLALSLAITGDTNGALSEMQAAVASPIPDSRQDANAILILALLGRTEEARSRGNHAIGEAATNVLLARAAAALAVPDPAGRARALGVTHPKPAESGQK